MCSSISSACTVVLNISFSAIAHDLFATFHPCLASSKIRCYVTDHRKHYYVQMLL